MINSNFLGYSAALSDGAAAPLLWTIGAFSLLIWAVGLRSEVWQTRWYKLFQSVALLALPALLLVGMVASMIPPA